MAKFKNQLEQIEAFTFDELVQHGINEVGEDNLMNGMPWSFFFRGHQITHEADDCYLVPTSGSWRFMRPGNMLIVEEDGYLRVCTLEVFLQSFEPAD